MANNPGAWRPAGYTGPTNQQQAGYNYAPGMGNPGYYQTPTAPTVTPTEEKKQPDTQATDTQSSGGMTDYEKWLTEQAAAEKQAQRNNVAAAVKALFSSYGLESLYQKIVAYAQQDYSAESIALMLRQTPEYKQRFPAMEALSKEGRAITEAEYIDYEKNAAALEQRYGLPKGMLMGNVTELLTKHVSASELNDRVVMSAAASTTAPDDFKRAMKDYYGIDQGGLAAYYLDPDLAMPLLEKQYAIAQIGGASYQQGLSTDLDTASQLRELGVSEDQARQGFGNVKESMGLTAGKGDTVSQKDLTLGTFGKADSAQTIQRAAKSRVNRFAGGGGFETDRQGVSGLGSSSG